MNTSCFSFHAVSSHLSSEVKFVFKMVHLHCLCLNVQISIEAKSDDTKDIPLQFPHQLPNCPDHDFFRKGVLVVKLDLGGVSCEISELTKQEQLRGAEWVVYSCLACNCITHAVHTPSFTHAASPALLSGPAVQSLMASERYSPVFKMVLPSEPLKSDQSPLSTTLLPVSLQKQLGQYTKQLEASCDERISIFKDNQRQLLHSSTEKAKHDSYALLSLLLKHNKLTTRRPSESVTDREAFKRQWSESSAREPISPDFDGGDELRHDELFDFSDDDGDRRPPPLSSPPLSPALSHEEDYCYTEEEGEYSCYTEEEGEYSCYTEEEAAEYLEAEAAAAQEREEQRRQLLNTEGVPPLAQSVPISVPNVGQPLPIRRPKEELPCKSPSEICARILQISASYNAQTEPHGRLFDRRRHMPVARTLHE
ncbi:hypothetical protein FHG87_015526 [Trinorchestia longiramus]|nr:hypothetical protein FHG87_015526 [Trinorchestia longiramus]